MKLCIHFFLAVCVLAQSGLSHSREVMMDGEQYGNNDSRQATYQRNSQRQQMLAQVGAQRAQAEGLLQDVELRLDFIAQSEHRELLLTLFENRKQTAVLTGAAGTGTLLLAHALKGETASGWGDVAAGISRRTSRLMIGAGVVLVGTGLYIGFSERAAVYEKSIQELSNMSDEEVKLYTVNKLDEFDRLFDHVRRLKELEACVNRASNPNECL